MALTGTLTGTGTRPKRTGILPRTRTGTIVYLNLATGFTTFTIENIERFRYVHFVDDSAGVKRKNGVDLLGVLIVLPVVREI